MRTQDFISEPARQTPVSGSYDVIVVGGGMSGVAAALAAARNSASVCLIDKQFGLGGLATLGNVSMWLPLCDGRGHQVVAGLGEELLKLSVADLQQDNPAVGFKRMPDCWLPGGDIQERVKFRYRADFNPASYMLALEALVVQNRISLLYGTRFCAVRRENERITHVIVENKSGRSALACKVVIDASGDADVCYVAGEKTVSLESNVLAAWFYTFSDGKLKRRTFTNKYCDQASVEGGQAPFFSGDDAQQVTDQILGSRQRMRELTAELRKDQSDADLHLIMPPTIPDLRMTRKLVGRFTLAGDHVHQWFDDAIGLTGDWRQSGPVYAIPFGSLLGVKNNNLLAVGRCISVANTAWDALRVFAPCTVTGEAAGTAAAIAVELSNGNLDDVEIGNLQSILMSQGVILDQKLVEMASAK